MAESSLYAPTIQYELFGGRISVRLFGRGEFNHDWSLASRGDTPPVLAGKWNDIACALMDSPARSIWAPTPVFGSELAIPGSGFTESRVSIESDKRFFRGPKADGVILDDPLHGYWVSPADCPTIIACRYPTLFHSRDEDVVVAHAGRNCLFDRERIDTGRKSRDYESIVDAIVANFLGHGGKKSIDKLKIHIIAGNGPEEFEHRLDDEKYGKTNSNLLWDVREKWGGDCIMGDRRRGRLVLTEIIRRQFMAHGVWAHNISHFPIDTYSDCDKNGKLIWWSNCRGHKERNGVLVVRQW